MERLASTPIVVAPDATPLERLAAAELQRYLGLLTGSVPDILNTIPPGSSAILVGRVAADIVGRLGTVPHIAEQTVYLQTVEVDGRHLHLVGGGSPMATQWAAYRLLEELGCG
ncbi:MAG TPA: hypothetical protein VIN09_11815, partial [Chloroflexota bacterium]